MIQEANGVFIVLHEIVEIVVRFQRTTISTISPFFLASNVALCYTFLLVRDTLMHEYYDGICHLQSTHALCQRRAPGACTEWLVVYKAGVPGDPVAALLRERRI